MRALMTNWTKDDGVTARSPMTLKNGFVIVRYGNWEATVVAIWYCLAERLEHSCRRVESGRAMNVWSVIGIGLFLLMAAARSGVKYGSCNN